MDAARHQDAEANVRDVIIGIVAEMAPAGASDVSPDTQLVAGLGFDSLGLLELVTAIEDALHVPDIPLEQFYGIERVADLQRVFQEARDRTGAGQSQ